jgi:hypothetical protein
MKEVRGTPATPIKAGSGGGSIAKGRVSKDRSGV